MHVYLCYRVEGDRARSCVIRQFLLDRNKNVAGFVPQRSLLLLDYFWFIFFIYGSSIFLRLIDCISKRQRYLMSRNKYYRVPQWIFLYLNFALTFHSSLKKTWVLFFYWYIEIWICKFVSFRYLSHEDRQLTFLYLFLRFLVKMKDRCSWNFLLECPFIYLFIYLFV